MNWLKIITRGGRQDLAKELLESYLTPETVTKWAADGVNSLLKRIADKERLAKVAENVSRASELCAKLSAAIADGEVSAAEAAAIRGAVYQLIGDVVTPAQIDALIEKVVKYVP